MRIQAEFDLQVTLADFLRRKYPRVKFLSDTRAAMKLSFAQQARSKKIQADDFAMPDMVIFEARQGFHGMMLELKKESPFRKDGTLKKDAHLERQQAAINALRAAGYAAGFFWDADMAMRSIEEYLR